jgi:hypothetical protein
VSLCELNFNWSENENDPGRLASLLVKVRLSSARVDLSGLDLFKGGQKTISLV